MSHYAQYLTLNHDNSYVTDCVSAINVFLLLEWIPITYWGKSLGCISSSFRHVLFITHQQVTWRDWLTAPRLMWVRAGTVMGRNHLTMLFSQHSLKWCISVQLGFGLGVCEESKFILSHHRVPRDNFENGFPNKQQYASYFQLGGKKRVCRLPMWEEPDSRELGSGGEAGRGHYWHFLLQLFRMLWSLNYVHVLL